MIDCFVLESGIAFSLQFRDIFRIIVTTKHLVFLSLLSDYACSVFLLLSQHKTRFLSFFLHASFIFVLSYFLSFVFSLSHFFLSSYHPPLLSPFLPPSLPPSLQIADEPEESHYSAVDMSQLRDKGPEIAVVNEEGLRAPLSKVEEKLDKHGGAAVSPGRSILDTVSHV